jgi:hypothetical protein
MIVDASRPKLIPFVGPPHLPQLGRNIPADYDALARSLCTPSLNWDADESQSPLVTPITL